MSDTEDLEKLSDALEECQIVKKEPSNIVLAEICDSSILAKFPKPKRIVPPVFLHKPVKFAPLMRKVLKLGIKFYRPNIGHHYTKVCCQTFDDHKALIQYFKKKQLPYHTFGHPDDRKMKVVFKGLPRDIDLNDFKNALESASIPIIRVHKMHNKECAKNRPLLVLVVVPNDDEGRKILQVQKCFEHSIEIEPPNSRNMQCYRCQKWGHSQRYCNGNVKCVRCGLDHLSHKCTKDPAEKHPRCANCGSDHTSSYKLCPFSPGSEQYVKKMLATVVSKGMFPNVCVIPRQLVTLENYHLLVRGII